MPDLNTAEIDQISSRVIEGLKRDLERLAVAKSSEPEWITTAKAAERLGVSRTTLWRHRSKLEFKAEGRKTLYLTTSIDALKGALNRQG